MNRHMPTPADPGRGDLMQRHAEARRRRDAAALGSDEYRAAAEEIARIEIAIAQLEEPPPAEQPGSPSA